MWSVFGVLLGNLIGVLPGMGALTAISMLLPLTYVIAPVPAILMLAGIFYGSMYGGAIGAILLNLPSHPPHAVTCIDGYPMTHAGPRRRRARRDDDVVVLRRLGRHPDHDLPLAGAGGRGLQVRADGDQRHHAAGPAGRRHHVARLAAEGRGDDPLRPLRRHDRHRRHQRHAALHLRPQRAERRRRPRCAEPGPLRHRRLPCDHQPQGHQGERREGQHARHATRPGPS